MIITFIGTVFTVNIFAIEASLPTLDAIMIGLTVFAMYVAHMFASAESDIMNPQYKRYATFNDQASNPTESKAALLAKAKEYMASCKNFRVAELARHLGMSETSVYGFFRNLGTTPINVKNEILLEEAKRLLCQTDLSVEQICGRVGFSSVAYFRKIVKESTGKNPLQLRRENSVESKI